MPAFFVHIQHTCELLSRIAMIPILSCFSGESASSLTNECHRPLNRIFIHTRYAGVHEKKDGFRQNI